MTTVDATELSAPESRSEQLWDVPPGDRLLGFNVVRSEAPVVGNTGLRANLIEGRHLGARFIEHGARFTER